LDRRLAELGGELFVRRKKTKPSPKLELWSNLGLDSRREIAAAGM